MMQFIQPTLWDAVDSQTGYRELCNFNFEEAERYFNNALSSPIEDQDFVQQALKACHFWKEELATGLKNLQVENFLHAFKNFSFSSQLLSFKKSLLKAATIEFIQNEKIQNFEPLFDELLKNGLFEEGIILVSRQLKKEPTSYHLHYYLGQCHYRMGQTYQAHENYAMALLLSPSTTWLNRIESQKLLNLIEGTDILAAYVYGVLSGTLIQLTVPKDFRPLNDDHDRYVRFYTGFQKAEKAGRINDRKKELFYRKEMLALDKKLFNQYMSFKKFKS